VPSTVADILSAPTVIPSPLPIFNVLPVLVKPAPATICPAPENCSNSKLVVPNVIG